jgi:hypothetical protein
MTWLYLCGFHVRVDGVAGQIEVLHNAVRVQGKCESRAPSAPMSV